MAEISVNCEDCGKSFKVIAEGTVANLTCPHCGNKILSEAANQTDDPLHLQEAA